jgi:hypothetical protein
MKTVPQWGSAVGAIALVIATLGVVVLLDVRHQRDVADDFLANGTVTVVDHVELHVRTGKGGDYIDEVEVAFAASTGSQRATLTNSLGDPQGNDLGRHVPDAGTRYASPLKVLYKPEDPAQVIAVVDAEEFAADSATPAVAAGMVSVGGTIALIVGVSTILNARLRRRWRSNLHRPE